jgi:hypothetical protein
VREVGVAVQAFPLDEGRGTVFIEVDDDDEVGSINVSRGRRIVAPSAHTLEQTFDAIRPAIEVVGAKLRAMAPERLTVEFGVKFTAEAGAIIARTSGEANFSVKLEWPGPSPA